MATDSVLIAWSQPKLALLDRLLAMAEKAGTVRACENDKESVQIDGHVILVSYGKYLSHYLHVEFAHMKEEADTRTS